ncbi:MAG: sugar transferase [Rhodospirillales bacterium]|nr:sugar transferase [Rhodospirillales bacterium]
MSYILQYSKTLRWLTPRAFDGGLAFVILVSGSLLFTREGVVHARPAIDLGMVALLTASAVAATCAVGPGSNGPAAGVPGEGAMRRVMMQAALAALVGALIAVPLGYAYVIVSREGTSLAPAWAQVSIALVPVSVFLSRCLQLVLRPGGRPPMRVAVVGHRTIGSRITSDVKTARPLQVVGFFEVDVDDPATGTASDQGLRDASSLNRFLEAARPDVVVVASAGSRRGDFDNTGLMVWDLLQAKAGGVRVVDFAEFWESEYGRIDLASLRADSLLFGPSLCGGTWYLICKRLVDIVFASTALAATTWMFPLIAILVKTTSRGPAIYRQERVGRNGAVFTLLKFRSMRPDAEQASGPAWARPGDPRITTIGSFLRRTRLDELPQLWNILRGDMTLVGPRPERPYFVDMLNRSLPFYGLRHAMRPGLTGWAQVNNGYAASTEESAEKLSYDLFYIRHSSMVFDFYIMVRTLGVIFRRAGQ